MRYHPHNTSTPSHYFKQSISATTRVFSGNIFPISCVEDSLGLVSNVIMKTWAFFIEENDLDLCRISFPRGKRKIRNTYSAKVRKKFTLLQDTNYTLQKYLLSTTLSTFSPIIPDKEARDQTSLSPEEEKQATLAWGRSMRVRH
ncbi:hypothetical protein JTE90_000297 [Oedothorax gibbosus]|uniref:Uncharacterized protein n=1 Tax=Oedothorax gibbosus TaxID=931172 RepID=A0AAV6VRZ8_9ARAC|nr:hypothetical protein JTE90_000297 [Oedothorax gibbosus]